MKMKVLIVDDDVNVVKGLKLLIPWEKLGYEVVGSASDGETGYELALRENPDVIISDIRMPKMDGTDFLVKIKKTLADVEFIFLSAYEDFPAAQLALNYCVKGYLLKPIDNSKIQQLIEYLSDFRKSVDRCKFYRTQLFDQESDLYRAIQFKDRGYFETLFHKLLEDAIRSVDDAGLIRTTCIRLAREMKAKWGAAFHIQEDIDLRTVKKKTDMILAIINACYACIDQDDSAHPILANVRVYVSQYLADDCLNVDFIAHRLNYSRSYISRIFQRYSGMSITDYITLSRIERACFLLMTTDKNIAVIAQEVGFHTPNYFTQVFKKNVGYLPSEYRTGRGQ